MGKIFARVVGAICFIVPAISFALGLGPITMRSSLNQPLEAEIDIHSAQPGDLDGLAIRLASPEDFARVNVERHVFLTQIQFSVKVRADGSSYILLTTRQPVTEPYLDFLIEARWPRGRALKEYTVLVDPPVLTAETPKPVEQSRTSPVFSEPERQQRRTIREPRETQPDIASAPPEPPPLRREPPPPVESEFSEPEPEQRQQPSRASGDVDYGRVRKGDTLWEIARDTRPDNSITIQQMMLAYLRDNPDAFIDGNINRLKAGYVLRIEDSSRISSTSRREAISEVRRQNLAWREGRSTRTVRQTEETTEVAGSDVTPDVDEGSEAATESRSETAQGPEVKLVAPGSEDLGSGGAAAEDDGQKVKEDLARASEALDAGRQESEDLTARAAELDEQLQSMQRLIQLKDEELLALQNQVAQNTVGKAIEEQEQQAAKREQAKPQPKQPKQQDMVQELLSDPVLLGLAGLLVFAVLGWLVMRRRRMHAGFEESILNVGQQVDGNGPISGQPESAMVSDFVMSDMPGGGTDVSEVDAISEADVYLAYGRHQQAEDILRQAMEQSPDRLDLHAKLLEVFHAAKNPEAFETEAQALHSRIGGDETNTYWTDIVSLGRELCPNSPLFGGDGGGIGGGDIGGVSEEEADLLDFDFDGASAAGGAGDDSDNSLDFDMSSLDFDMDTGSDSRSTANDSMASIDSFDAPVAEEDTSGAIDFDMSLDDDSSDTVLHDTSDDSSISLDMDSDMSLDMDSSSSSSDDFGMSLDFESSSDDSGSIELSLDENDSSIGMASSMDDDDDMSMDFDQGADIVQLDTGGGDDIDLDGELDEDIFNNVDEVGTKLDLAKAYVDMGDSDGARSILDEVLEEGDDTQKQQAEELLQQMG